MALICGIEEAGKGPIIGPLVMVGLVIDEKDEPYLKDHGIKDSKLLTPTQRNHAEQHILKVTKKHIITKLSPQDIDNALNDPNTNLNWLEADNTITMLNELQPDKAYIDCPSPNIKAYTSYIQERLTCKTTILCAHHADKRFPVVSAASIIAKVERDKEVERIKKTLHVDFGSGYMADPKTKQFFDTHWDTHQDIFRHTWAPYKKKIAALKQHQLGDY